MLSGHDPLLEQLLENTMAIGEQ